MTEHLLGVQKNLNLSPIIKMFVIYRVWISLRKGTESWGEKRRERAFSKLVRNTEPEA